MKSRLLTAILGAAAVLGVNVAVPSYLNFYHWHGDKFDRWRGFVSYIVDLHADKVAPFARRPLTSAVVHALELPGFDPWAAFAIGQLLLLALSALALARLSNRLRPGTGTLSIAAYFASFSVLFSFVTPNDAYDEAAQYLCLFLALDFLLRGKRWQFALAFFASLLARETSLLLLPAMAIAVPAEGRRLRDCLTAAGAVAAYAGATFILWRGDDPHRGEYLFRNFAGAAISVETFVSAGLALAVPVLVALAAGVRRHPAWKPFLASCLLNVPAVLLFAYARESRLFALPLVFLWPWCGAWLAELKDAHGRLPWRDWWRWFPPVLLAASVAVFYQPAYRSAGVYRGSAVACALLLGAALLLRGRSSRESTSR